MIFSKTKQQFFDKPTFDTNFEVRICKSFSKNDGMLKIIGITVFQLGKHNHLLKKLSKTQSNNENNNQNGKNEHGANIIVHDIAMF